jgi:hypothetical protein
VLWSLESYRHGLKEQAPDEKRLPTQKEITMKKLLAIKERPADGGQDAREKGDGMKKSCIAVTRFMSLTPCVSIYCN